jgi:hypothetical protein
MFEGLDDQLLEDIVAKGAEAVKRRTEERTNALADVRTFAEKLSEAFGVQRGLEKATGENQPDFVERLGRENLLNEKQVRAFKKIQWTGNQVVHLTHKETDQDVDQCWAAFDMIVGQLPRQIQSQISTKAAQLTLDATKEGPRGKDGQDGKDGIDGKDGDRGAVVEKTSHKSAILVGIGSAIVVSLIAFSFLGGSTPKDTQQPQEVVAQPEFHPQANSQAPTDNATAQLSKANDANDPQPPPIAPAPSTNRPSTVIGFGNSEPERPKPTDVSKRTEQWNAALGRYRNALARAQEGRDRDQLRVDREKTEAQNQLDYENSEFGREMNKPYECWRDGVVQTCTKRKMSVFHNERAIEYERAADRRYADRKAAADRDLKREAQSICAKDSCD